MVDLCNKLLNSDTSTDSLTGSIMTLARTVEAHDGETFRVRIPSEKVIGCLRTANRHLPDLHQVSFMLAQSLFNHFYITVSEDDYNEGMAILDKLISFRGPGDTPRPEWGSTLKYASCYSYS